MGKFQITVAILFLGCQGHAQTSAPPLTTVRGHVEVAGKSTNSRKRQDAIPETIVWLTPFSADDAGTSGREQPSPFPKKTPLRLVQQNKSFQPHVLVVPAGSDVEFPNRDPFFHNVFSLFEGKRFDLGLYEAGSSRIVRFDRPGISYIFCNIHPEMSGIVITVTTSLYGVSNPAGQIMMQNVPVGHYVLHVWSESMGSENTQPMTRDVVITEGSSSLGSIRVPEGTRHSMAHKNKYGRNYDSPTPDGSVYEQPQ